MCASPVPHNRISSFFDVFAEVTFNGNTWTPGNAAIHVEQEPAAATGDCNGDGIADAADYTVCATHWVKLEWDCPPTEMEAA